MEVSGGRMQMDVTRPSEANIYIVGTFLRRRLPPRRCIDSPSSER